MKYIDSIGEIPVLAEIIQEFKRVGDIQNNNADHDRREQLYFEIKIDPYRDYGNDEESVFMFDKLIKIEINQHSPDKIAQ